MKAKYLVIVPFAAILAGCHSSKQLQYSYVTADSAPVQSTDTNAQAQLAEAAVSVGQSLQQLSAIQEATHPGVKMPAPANPGALGMSQQTSVNWTGPVQPILNRLANAAHYKLSVIGSAPAIPVIVNVNANNQTIYNVIRNIKYQVANKATVTIYSKNRSVELRYKAA